MIMPIGYYMTILPFHHLPVMLLHQLAAVLLMEIGNPTGSLLLIETGSRSSAVRAAQARAQCSKWHVQAGGLPCTSGR